MAENPNMVGTTAVSRALEVTSHLNSTVEELFSYLTTGSLLEHWICNKAHTVAEKGGEFGLWIESDTTDRPDIYGQFINMIPNRTVQYVWIDEKRGIKSLVTAVMNQKGEQVRLDLYHTNLPFGEQYDDAYYEYAKFWKAAFNRLNDHLAE